MMKVLLLTVSLLVSTFITKAQKSGILQKDYYGAFTGNDWEDFLAGKRATDFEKKSNVTLASYLGVIQQLVTGELKESTIASAVMNSTVVSFPEGSDVYTADANGNWKTRTAYPGEKGFMHTKTRICWLSFQCGNMVKTIFGNPVTPSAPPAGAPDPALMVKYTPPGSTNNNTINVNPPGNTNGSNELTWNVGYGVYSMGRNDRQNDFIVDASLYKMIQDAKQCCGGGATAPVQQISYATPSMVMQAAPASQQPNYSQNNQVNGRLAVDVTQRARAVDWAAATGQVMQGVGAIKMAFFPEPVDVKIRGGNASAVYGTSWTPTVYGTGFQGSNQLNALIPNTTTSNSPYGNTWGNAGTGLGLMPIGN